MSYSLLRPFLFTMEPEQAHDCTLRLLERCNKMHLLGFIASSRALPVTCMGVHFPNPIGLAAGLDKNGAYIDALAQLGFGFIEIGTVTPKAQAGNAQPRLFRLKEYGAIINRMGFNNDGVDALVANVRRAKYQGALGINIGKNATTPTEKALDDYLYCLERVYAHASYIAVNISSPNTKNLRALQEGDALAALLEGLKDRHAQLATTHGFYVPVALKIAPDLSDDQIDVIAQRLIEFEIDGLIATNTTLSRFGVEMHPSAVEAGGLSGRPLAYRSNEILQKFADRLANKVDIVGAGGVDNPEAAVTKIRLGAKAVQLYSGLVYKGPSLIFSCINSVDDYMDAQAASAADVDQGAP